MIDIVQYFRQSICIPVILSIMFLWGCAAKVAPIETISGAEMSVKVAEEREAAIYAPLELKLANDKLKEARTAMQKEDFEKARHIAEQALLDAKLAEVKALSEKAKKAAQDMRQGIETLKHEIEWKQKQHQ
jgi:hypothetical protein